MKRPRHLILATLLLAACFSGLCRADLDGPAPILSGGSLSSGGSGDVQVVCALICGNKSCTNVTEKIGSLLNSPNGFFVKETGEDGSLVIVYNSDGHRHYFARSYGGPKVSMGLLKEAARIDDAKAAEAPRQPKAMTMDESMHVVFAAYGAHEMYWDVTDIVAKPLEAGTGLTVNPESMGGDPEWGSGKSLYIVYDYKGERHVFAAGEGQAVTVEAGQLAVAESKRKTRPSKNTGTSDTPVAPEPVAPLDPNYKPFGH